VRNHNRIEAAFVFFEVLLHFEGVEGRLVHHLETLFPGEAVPAVQPTFKAVKRNLPALEGGIGGQRVTYLNIVGIFNLHRHFVENVDFIPPQARIAQIAVIVFVGCIKVHQVLVFGDVPVEFAFFLVGTCPAMRVAEGMVVPVMFEGSEGVHLDGV